MTRFLVLIGLLLPTAVFAQRLPGNFTCQDLIDAADGKSSRSNDGGRTYVPINVPRPSDAYGQALLAYDTHLCRRLVRGEIGVSEFDALQADKAQQLATNMQKALADRKNIENQERALRNQEQALQNQERALQNQQQQIQTQREAVQVQRQTAIIQVQQAEAARRQQAAQHEEAMRQQQIQTQQLQQIQSQQQQIRQEQARPRSFSCFGGGNYIQCN